MKVLSLFGGIEAGRVALDKLGIIPESYHSAEIDPYPSKVASANYQDIVHVGSVTEVDGHDYEDVDLLIGGPPCQDLSIAGKRAGLEGSRSSLFWEYVRVLKEAEPKFFLVENVASMPDDAKRTMTEALFGIEPVLINSALVSAQNRKRLFWIGKRNADGTYSKLDVPQPENERITLKDVLEEIPHDDSSWKPLPPVYLETARERVSQFPAVAQFRRTYLRVHADQEKSPTLTANMGTGGHNVPIIIRAGDYYWRKFSVSECASLQGFPKTFRFDSVSNSRAYKGIGNSWNVDVIVHIFSRILETGIIK